MVFRSAFNYLSQASTILTGQGDQHPLVGQSIEIGGKQFNVRALLAEGGFALVFSVQESRTGEWFALKRQLAADRIAADAIIREINFLKQLSGHPAIVHFNTATQISPEKRSGQQQYYAEFLMLTELCTGGSLIDYLRKEDLSTEQICKIFHTVSSAVRHMHDRNPPITHRDIKIENLLFDSRGFIKLCDFGSATTDIYRPDEDWNAMMRTELEEEMAKFTTPMYRAPEILDTYQNYPIGPAQDIWALGCVLFYLCYKVHPFEDSAKLRILNASYTLPSKSQFQIFHDLIRRILQPDPYSRPSIQDLCEQVEDVTMALNVKLDEPVIQPEKLDSLIQLDAQNSSLGNQQARMFFDQGMNLIKTIKERSPVLNISEQLKSQLGFESTHAGVKNSEQKKMAPPRPLAPPSIQTKITQLTHREPFDLCTKSATNDLQKTFFSSISTDKSSVPSNEKARSDQNQQQYPTSSQNATPIDFFNSLNWNEDSSKQLQSGNGTNSISAKNEFGFPDLLSRPTEFKKQPEMDYQATDPAPILPEFDRPNCQELSGNEHANKAGSSDNVDLLKLLEEEIPSTTMYRNKSAPSFASAGCDQDKTTEDIFAKFLSEGIAQGGLENQENNYQRPNYSRKHFDEKTEVKPDRPTKNIAFDDLLSEQGFTSSSKNSKRTLADLVKERDAEEMDPIALKIKYWTDGKQRNIRALLGSLSDVIWEEAKVNWVQPSVAELFEADKIKKHYRKACLVVHPDKQSGSVHEPLAKAIFTELNDAWNEFVSSNQ